MKQLESVKLVQFFLFEQTELRLKEITGLFGRNGSGKSSILDAIQIAMLGGNKSLVAFNAQADQSSNSHRTLRDYCLGRHGPDLEHRIRDQATTYITLVWRDTETNEPTSMGICVEASCDSETDKVVGRYVLRGVELAMADHLDIVDGQPRPRDWKGFRHQLQERSIIAIGDDFLFDDARHYVDAAMLALRGKAGPASYDAFTRAFRFGLRMRFDKSVDHIVRNDVLENRPTNIRRFKELTESFKKLSNLVAQTEKKIGDGSKVSDSFALASTESKRVATWTGLAASAHQANCSKTHEEYVAQYAREDELLGTLKARSSEVADGLVKLEKDIAHQIQLQMAHTAHADNAHVQADRLSAENSFIEKKKAADQNLQTIHRILSKNAHDKYLGNFKDEMLNAAEAVSSILINIATTSKQDVETTIRQVGKLANRIVNELFKDQRSIESQIATAQDEVNVKKGSLERAKAGRAAISEQAQKLVNEFKDHGLDPRPVCDLVRIADPDWQPVIEAYLGKNVEALLVGESDEATAFKLYRGMEGRRAIYGVKIVRTNKNKIVEVPLRGSVAELIEGNDPAAVAYLRQKLGRLRCAIDNNEALAHERSLTKDGMLVGPGEFDRLQPVPASELMIGMGVRGQVDTLIREIRQLTDELGRLKGQKDELEILRGAMSSMAGDNTRLLILNCVESMHEASNTLGLAKERAATHDNAEYQALCDVLGKLEKQLQPAKTAANLASEKAIRAEEALKSILKFREQAAEALALSAILVDETRQDVDYDKLFASDQWDKLLEQFKDDYTGMAAYCRQQSESAKQKFLRLVNEAFRLLGTYLAEYREALGQEIRDDWRKSHDWINEQVKRIQDTELLEYKVDAEKAYKTSQETFRNDVAIALSNNLDALDVTFDRLNKALRSTPVFSNGERYIFIRKVRPNLVATLRFVKDIAAHGADGSLFGNAGAVPAEFEDLLRDKVTSGTAGQKSVLDDYREFFEFDIRIDRENPETGDLKSIGMLSKRLGQGSGGEHRAPLYVIAGAALASAYRLDELNKDGPRLILLDEAFDKMDMTNIIATMRYLEQLGLQVLMASPGENLSILNAFLHRYYEIQKDSLLNVIEVNECDISEAMRQMFREDIPEFDPALLEQELQIVRKQYGNSETSEVLKLA
jgi:chromosome segregation protein